MPRDTECPECGVNLVSGKIVDIWRGMKEYDDKSDEQLREMARKHYGGEDECFYRTIGIYSRARDRTTHWLCPDCNHEWGHIDNDKEGM